LGGQQVGGEFLLQFQVVLAQFLLVVEQFVVNGLLPLFAAFGEFIAGAQGVGGEVFQLRVDGEKDYGRCISVIIMI